MPADTELDQDDQGLDQLDRPYVLALIRDRLAEILEIEPSAITEGASFVEDLDADSLALIELVEAIEADIAHRDPTFRIEDEDLEDLKTVRDAVDYVVSYTGRAGSHTGRDPRAGGAPS